MVSQGLSSITRHWGKPHPRATKGLHSPSLTFALMLLVISPLVSQVRQHKFFRLTQEDGLASYRVYDMAQDQKGFLWIGTLNGLNRYDGYGFTLYQYHEADSCSLSDNVARCLLVDNSGTLWVGTDAGGLNRFNRIKETFARFVHNPKNPEGITEGGIRALYQDRAGTIWIGTLGGGLDNLVCSPETISVHTRGVFNHYRHDPKNPRSLSNDYVYAILEDNAGTLWVGTDNGLNALDQRTGRFTRFVNNPKDPQSLSSNLVRAIIQDHAGILWVGTESGGLNRFDRATNRFTHYHHSKSNTSLGSDEVLSIAERNRTTLWVGTVEGLNIFDKTSGKCIRLKREATNVFSMPDDRIRVIRRDRTGVMWFATDRGLAKAPPRLEQFKHYLLDRDYLKPQSVASVVASNVEEDLLWVGTGGSGLKLFNLRSGTVVTFKHDPADRGSLPSDWIQSLFLDRKGILWIGTFGGGLAKYDMEKREFLNYDWGATARSFAIMTICSDNHGLLWLGTNGDGLLRFDPTTGRFIQYRNDPLDPGSIGSNNVFAVLEDTQHALWIATEGGGLHKYERESNRFIHYKHDQDNPHSISSDFVYSLLEDSKGRMWLSTQNGLNLFDRSTQTFELIRQADSITTPTSTVIVEDDRSRLWLNRSEGGLYEFDPQIRTFKRYDVSDGLQGQVFSKAACKRRNGELVFGGENGLSVFHPDSIAPNRSIPATVLTSFRVFDKPPSLDTSISEIGTLALNYNENYFSFEFAALDFGAPAKNKYAYMLEGLDKGWVYPEDRRFASYTNIDPGRYVFKVKASNNDGIWNEAGISLPITIRPPYWATWWFRSLVAIILLALAAGGYNYRVSKLLEMERMRVRIASDLHDDIGSSLSSIALITDMVRNHLPADQVNRQRLQDASRAARHTADALKDIVWIINPENDKLEDITLRMKDGASKLLAGIDYTFECNSGSLSNVLDMEFRRHLLLIYKEVLNNIAKHARASHVEISIGQADGTLIMKIRDNGVGFDELTIQRGNGLRNLRKRAAEINGTIEVSSTPGEGTNVVLRAEFTG